MRNAATGHKGQSHAKNARIIVARPNGTHRTGDRALRTAVLVGCNCAFYLVYGQRTEHRQVATVTDGAHLQLVPVHTLILFRLVVLQPYLFSKMNHARTTRGIAILSKCFTHATLERFVRNVVRRASTWRKDVVANRSFSYKAIVT